MYILPVFCWGGAASDLARQIHQAPLDSGECYRIRDLRFVRDEIKLYFSDGFLIFSKPVNGVRVSAVFSAEVEGGDAELLLMPPTQRERRSLATFAKSPTLSEHFRNSVLLFTDNSAAELLETIKEAQAKKSAEMGNLLAGKWNPVLGSFLSSFEVRLVEDLLSPSRVREGFFFAAIGGSSLGNFDVIYDPRMRQQISIGQIAYRDERRYFDVWANFESRSFRLGQRVFKEPEFKVELVRIQAVIEPDLMLKAITRIRVLPGRTERTIALDISRRMKVTGAKVNGAPAEAYYPESLRANLLRSGDNHILLITADREFAAGKPVEVELEHEGRVIAPAGNDVYFVGARGVWYPNRSQQFSDYDVTFRFPKHLDLVATGDLISETTEGEYKVSRRKTSSPVRVFGFNLGSYERTTIKRGGLTVEVCANRKLETALQPRPRPVEINPNPPGGFPSARGPRRPQPDILMVPLPPPNPAARLQQLASGIAATYEEMAARLGKPPLHTLTISPIPGRFGQGFPGLVYLSTISYLDPSERPIGRGGALQQTFFSDILHSHELAHQWWGNGVTSAGYQDDWLMEALANYSALWVLEGKRGIRTLDAVLEEYRNNLLKKGEDGRTVESAGPVTMGHRLTSSHTPGSWPVITYEKGSWIIHMLRRRLGDERFQKMLAQLYQKNLYGALTTGQFRETAREFVPPGSPDPTLESFFETWVNGTGIPALKLSWQVGGKAPKVRLTGTITQTEADENFSTWVPVEIQTGRAKAIVHWVHTSSEPVQFSINLTGPPLKVTLDPGNAALARK